MILERLRSETRQAHERLESKLDLMRPDLGMARYGELLGRFWGFWRVWEPAVETAFGDPGFTRERRRLHLLERDLEAVGLGGALGTLPLCPELPRLQGAEDALGSMYVLEGSTLGGRHISRHLGRTLGLGPGNGAGYFDGYGERTGSMWRAFGARLESASTPGTQGRTVHAAIETFEILERWLCEPAAAEV